MIAIHRGLSRDDALRAATERGCTIRYDAGDVLVFHTAWSRSLRLNNRRKDCARALVSSLRKLPNPS